MIKHLGNSRGAHIIHDRHINIPHFIYFIIDDSPSGPSIVPIQ